MSFILSRLSRRRDSRPDPLQHRLDALAVQRRRPLGYSSFAR